MKRLDSFNVKEMIDRHRSALERSTVNQAASINQNIYAGKVSFTINELALSLGVSTRTVERLLKRKEIAYKKVGRRVVIPVSAVEAWLNQKD